VGIYLGPGTHDCTVVGGPNKTTVVDEGTNNVLVGVNNMGHRRGADHPEFSEISLAA